MARTLTVTAWRAYAAETHASATLSPRMKIAYLIMRACRNNHEILKDHAPLGGPRAKGVRAMAVRAQAGQCFNHASCGNDLDAGAYLTCLVRRVAVAGDALTGESKSHRGTWSHVEGLTVATCRECNADPMRPDVIHARSLSDWQVSVIVPSWAGATGGPRATDVHRTGLWEWAK